MVSSPMKEVRLRLSRALSPSSERGYPRLLDPDGRASWTTMAGRLGVLRRLVGVEGSMVVVQLEGARAESLRSSSSQCCVRRSADALGPGEVRGRRTLLSHPRVAGPAGALGVAAAGVAGAAAAGGFSAEEVSATGLSDAGAASSLMAGVRRNLPS